MIRTQISFDEHLYKIAQKTAKQQGISLAELCRRGLLAILGEQKIEKPWMHYAGMFSCQPDTTSETIDEVVYGREEP